MSLVEVKAMRIHLGNRLIVDDVSLNVEAGEVVGLIGPNGAGKSTIMKAIMKIIRFQSGSISILDQSIRQLSPQLLARRVSYLSQGQPIYWPLAVDKVIALGRIPHLMPWQSLRTEDFHAIKQAMIDTGITHLAARPVNELAGGEKMLVMLSRALAAEPSVILADEPVAGLDPNHQIQAMQLLNSLAQKGRGILVVLHNLTLAARFCQRLFLLRDGRILASGKPKDVLSPENLKQGYEVEARFGHHDGEFFVIPWKRL